MMSNDLVEIGVFGGSGFYSLLENAEERRIETPYGPPSDVVTIGEIAGKRVAFLPRHGKTHSHPPHMVNFRANVYAMHSLGVKRIIGPSAVGSLQPQIKPGDFVVVDQFVDRTRGRKDTFYDGPITTHVSSADPYCPQLRQLAIEVTKDLGIPCHESGTNVVIQGPRFSTKAESRWFTRMGWEVVGMTQYPECILARELEMCYASIALCTDYDTGLVGLPGTEPVSADQIIHMLHSNIERVKAVIVEMVKRMPAERMCECGDALKFARLG